MIETFVLKLLVGIALMWLLMPRKEVTDGFFRIQMLVALGLSVLLVLIVSSDTAAENRFFCIAQVVSAFVAFAGHIVWKLGRRLPGVIAIYSIAFLSFLSLFSMSCAGGLDRESLQLFLSNTASSAVLGATLTSMLLGHWYLTTPTMSIGPLSWFTRALAVAAVGRLLMTGLSFGLFGLATHNFFHLVLLFLRIFGGIVVPLVTAVVVARILRYRNTQSATGVLFAALILVFMGEMAAALLERDLRIPY